MTIKEYLKDKTLIAVETVDSLILNLVTEKGIIRGLDIDTSSIPDYTPLIRTENFILTSTELETDGITIDITTTNILE